MQRIIRKGRLVENHHALVNDGVARKTIITIPEQDLDRHIIVRNCSNITIRGAVVQNWSAPGHDITKGKPYGIEIREGCTNVTLESPVIVGSPDDVSKRTWRRSVANGLIVRDGNVGTRIIKPFIRRVHFGLDLRGDGGCVMGGSVAEISADHLCGRGDGWTIDGIELYRSLAILAYKELHRDLIQLYHKISADGSPGFISDWIVRNCRLGKAYENGKPAQYEEPAQIWLLSDGIGRNIKFLNNTIITGHDLTIKASVCIGAEIRGNRIWTMGDCRPQVMVMEKRYGVSSEAIVIKDNPIRSIADLTAEDLGLSSFDEGSYSNFSETELEAVDELQGVSLPKTPEPIVITENNQTDFAEFVAKCRNKNAPALTQQDYLQAGKRLNVGALMIKAFFQVESIRDGYLSDGSLKGLLERHWVHRISRRRGVLQEIQQSAGLANCNPNPGGYKGGKAEYYRARTVCDSGEPEALDIVLSSMSIGLPQIMGFNHKEAGYSSPREMFEHMHLSERNQLDAFCSFIEAKGLIPLLQQAEERLSAGKRSGKYLAKVAEIYNGKKHKQYDLKIARAYRVLAEAENEIVIKPKRKSNTLQGTAVSTTGNVGTVGSLAVLMDQLQTAKDVADAAVNKLQKAREIGEITAAKFQAEVDALKEQAAEPNYMLWVVVGFVVLSQSGAILSALARLRDRFTGKNP